MGSVLEGYARWKSRARHGRYRRAAPGNRLARGLGDEALHLAALRLAGRRAGDRRPGSGSAHLCRPGNPPGKENDRLGECLAYRALARLAEREANREAAEAYLGRAVSAARARGSELDEALTLAELGELQEDATLLRQAAAQFSSMNLAQHERTVAAVLDRIEPPATSGL